MDRKFVYPGQIPLETDLLGTNQYAMVGLAKLSAAIFGTGGVASGLVVSPNSPAALNVVVGSGEIYQLQNLEATPYSSLPADTTNTCVKQGIQLGSVVLACPAPTTAGFSVNYLIEATYADADINPVTLPYYNASNPTQAYSGPNNTGAQQATTRAGQVQLQVKAGIAATTGTQTTPAVDAGYIALAVVTVANGQTTIAAGNITPFVTSQILTQSVLAQLNAQSVGRLLNVQTFTTNGTYTPTPGTKKVRVTVVGGGGGSGAVSAASSGLSTCGISGGGGGWAVGIFTSGFAGASVVVGAGGVAGVAGGSNPTSGGTSSFLTMSATGGGTGVNSNANTPPQVVQAATAGAGSGGSIANGNGDESGVGFAATAANVVVGLSGASIFGGRRSSGVTNGAIVGVAGASYGAGAVGACNTGGNVARNGAAGASGVVIIEEFT